MELDPRVHAAQEAAGAHDGTASADTGDECVGDDAARPELGPDLGSRGALVGLAVVLVGELAREESAGRGARQLLGEADAPEEPALGGADEAHVGSEGPEEVDALGAQPVWDEDRNGMAEGPADGREADPRVAARGLDDEGAGRERSFLVRAREDVQRHAVLDAPRHVEGLDLGVEMGPPALEGVVDGKERRVADEAAEPREARGARVRAMLRERLPVGAGARLLRGFLGMAGGDHGRSPDGTPNSGTF